MCGRYTIAVATKTLEARFQARLQESLLAPNYNAAPSQDLPIIVDAAPAVIAHGTWGFMPEWAGRRHDVKSIINARAETAATKPFFRQAFKTKRCLILADGFYEWKRTGTHKTPYRITLVTAAPFAFAGLWSTIPDAQGTPYTTFAILTTEANEQITPIHTRMPVILQPQDEAAWLNPEAAPEAVQSLLKPYPEGQLRVYEVSPRVNSPTYNTPEALLPVAHGA